MSNKRLTAVWDRSPQKGTALLALLSLADQAADDGYCWPSHAYIAQRARSTPKYIAEVIMPKLEKEGEIIVFQRPGTSNAYLVTAGLSSGELVEACKKRFKTGNDEAMAKVEAVQQLPRETPPVKQGDSPPAPQGDTPPVQQGINPNITQKEPTTPPKTAVDILETELGKIEWEDDEDDFVEEIEYGPADPFAGDYENSLQNPKWRDPDRYKWQHRDLLDAALKATGRKKFGSKKEFSAWRAIDQGMVSLKINPETKYPIEWVALMIEWAKDKNTTAVNGAGSFVTKIKFPALLSAILNEAKKNDFAKQMLDSNEDDALRAEDFIAPVSDNPFADRLK